MNACVRLTFIALACTCAALGLAGEALATRGALTAPVLFVKQFNYQGLHIYDTFYQWRPGGGIYVLENPGDPPELHRVRAVIDPTTPETLGAGIYFDPSLSYDATKLLFCFKGSEQGNSVIYEIGVSLSSGSGQAGKGLRQLTNLDANGNPYKGKGSGHHDVKPCYLPDGRIVFTSTRYSGLVPCANNGVAILHVMGADGSDIHTISVNNVTEFDPCVLPDGRILFGRWEYVDRNALVIQSLWTVLPDGRNETALYANNMVFPEAVLQAKPVPGNESLVVAAFTPHNSPPRGTIAMIDTRVGKNDTAAIFNFESPEAPTRDRGESCDPWPLSEQAVLYSGTPPEADAPAIPLDAPGFRKRSSPKLNALMLIDRSGRRTVVHSDPAIDLHSPIPLAPRPLPRVNIDLTDRSQRTGNFYVNDVYTSMPTVRRGTVKWLRVLEETSRVSESPGGSWMNQTFMISAAMAWSAKIYHGIVPVEPDGSVYFEAPSGRALYFQLLDQDYRLVRGMRTFIQAVPGTTRSCAGCHEYNPLASGVAHFSNRKPRALTDESWGGGYLDYASRVQPILDAKCVSCHGGERGLAKGLDLSRGWTEFFNISYEHLTARREKMYTADLIAGICAMNGTAYWSCKVFDPYAHGSGKAPLADILLTEPHRSRLTQQEREQLFAWMDSNGMYFGTWDYTSAGPTAKPFLKAVAEVKAVMAEAGCARCHANEKGEIKRFDQWINLDAPELSRVLRAPLPASTAAEGGYGLALCRDRKVDQTFSRKGLIYGFGYAHGVLDLDKFPTQTWPAVWPSEGQPVTSFASTSDANYQKMLGVIREARAAQLACPRVDMPGADVVGDGVHEGRSRQILPQPLPEPLPAVRARVDENGFVRLSWESSARMIGLVAEIFRGGDASFALGDATRIARTERSVYCDTHPPAGEVHYAVVFVSDPAETCGTCKSGAVLDYQHEGHAAVVRAQRGERCPLSTFVPLRSAPARTAAEVPAARPALHVPRPSAQAELRHRFVCIDNAKDAKLLYVDQFNPSNNWTRAVSAASRSLQRVEGGRVLVGLATGFAEFDLNTGAVAARAEGYRRISAVSRRPDGSTWLAESTATGVVIHCVGKDMRPSCDCRLLYPDASAFRVMQVLDNGHVLMPVSKPFRAVEIGADGTVVWRAALDAYGDKGYLVRRLPDGTTLASTGSGVKVVQLDPAGRAVRFWGEARKGDHPEWRLDFFSGFERLPNGHVVVANWLGHGKHGTGPHLVEFDDDNACVWQWEDHAAARQVTNVLLID